MSKAKTRKKTDSNRARRETEALSYSEEAVLDYEMGLEALKIYQDSGLSFHLRRAGILFKMAADRDDHSEHLQGNTLVSYIKEAEKT